MRDAETLDIFQLQQILHHILYMLTHAADYSIA